MPQPARAGWGMWNRFWFDPIPASRVGLLRIWLFGFTFLDVLLRKEASVALGDTPRLFWRPVGATWLLEEVDIGPPNTWQIAAVQVVLASAALLAAIGYRYRFTAPVAAVLYLYWQSLGQSWGEMKHARVTLVLALLFLCLVRAEQRRSVDSWRAKRALAASDPQRAAQYPDDEPSRNGAWAVRRPGRARSALLPVRVLQAARHRHRLDLE